MYAGVLHQQDLGLRGEVGVQVGRQLLQSGHDHPGLLSLDHWPI
ncbi:MAG: hypothetical protein JWM79_3917, partial [Nocardioides sp.]|nr:hypothetical protein [Nocardioides sp.]